jgi:hypothetical protein
VGFWNVIIVVWFSVFLLPLGLFRRYFPRVVLRLGNTYRFPLGGIGGR